RLRAQLMLALYRSGRQAEALEVYRQARRTLLDELGLEPGRRLQELERAILRQDARLAPRSSRRSTVNAFRRRRRVMIAIGAGLVVVASVALWLIESTGGSPKPRSA